MQARQEPFDNRQDPPADLGDAAPVRMQPVIKVERRVKRHAIEEKRIELYICLLYTSDAADD